MWLKQFRKKKLQSALIFLIITLCSLLITGSIIILTSLSSPYNELAEETDCADLKIYPAIHAEVSGKDWQDYIGSIDGVSSVSAINAYSLSSLFIDGGKEDVFIDLCLYSSDYKNVRVLEGSLDGLTDGKCAIPSAVAYESGIEVGDTVYVPNGDERVQYTVVAVFADVYSMSTAFTGDMIVNSLPSGVEAHKVFMVRLEDGYTTEQFISDYAEKNNGIIDGYFRTSNECIGNAALTEKIMGGVLLGISVCLFLVILLIITYIIKSSLRRDKKNIAVYKAIGYTERKIAGIYITFYQAVVFAGSVVGAMSSFIVSLAFMRAAYRNLGVENTSADLWQKLMCIGIINLITLIILLREFSRLKSVKPVEILTGSEEYGKKKLKERRGFVRSFSPFAMAMRMLVREKKRSAIIIVTCIVSVYIVNIAVVSLQNLDLISGETNYYWLGIDNHDVSVENIADDKSFAAICDELERDERVARFTRKNYGLNFAIPYHESVSAAVMESFEGIEMDVVAGRNPQANNEVAIGNVYFDELGVEIGDYLDLCLDENTTVSLLVVGSYQGFYNMGRRIRLLGGLLEENDIYFNYSAASVILTEGTDKEQFTADAEARYGNYITAIDRRHLYENIMDMICEPQKNALLPFVVITVIIGAVNLFYIIYSNNCENRKKNTILRSLGFSASHIMKTNLIYIAFIAAVSVAVAIPALIYLFPQLMILAMSGFGFAEYELTVYPVTVVLINGGMFLLFMLITAATGRELYKNHLNSIINE